MACAGLSLLILLAACNGAVQPDAMTLQNVHEDHLQLSQRCPLYILALLLRILRSHFSLNSQSVHYTIPTEPLLKQARIKENCVNFKSSYRQSPLKSLNYDY